MIELMTALASLGLGLLGALAFAAIESTRHLRRIADNLDAIRYQQNIIGNCELELVKVHSGVAAQQKWRA